METLLIGFSIAIIALIFLAPFYATYKLAKTKNQSVSWWLFLTLFVSWLAPMALASKPPFKKDQRLKNGIGKLVFAALGIIGMVQTGMETSGILMMLVLVGLFIVSGVRDIQGEKVSRVENASTQDIRKAA